MNTEICLVAVASTYRGKWGSFSEPGTQGGWQVGRAETLLGENAVMWSAVEYFLFCLTSF